MLLWLRGEEGMMDFFAIQIVFVANVDFDLLYRRVKQTMTAEFSCSSNKPTINRACLACSHSISCFQLNRHNDAIILYLMDEAQDDVSLCFLFYGHSTDWRYKSRHHFLNSKSQISM
jgi:hypothetical protein